MTSLIGIKTNTGPEAIVLGSDTQLNYLDDEGNLVAKKSILKIIHGDFWAIACCGAETNEMKSFFRKLQNPEDRRYKNFDKDRLDTMMNKALGKGRFYEINELNANYSREGGDISEAPEFLIAFNKPKVELFKIDPFGNLIPPKKSYITLGTGREEVEKYLEEIFEEETYEENAIDLEAALKLSRDAVKKTSQRGDIFSGWPMDLVVTKKNSIKAYGNRIRSAIEKAEDKEFEAIINEEVGKVDKE